MLIPIRCLSCGHVIADKWNAYLKGCENIKENCEDKSEGGRENSTPTKTRGDVMNDLGIKRICCRRHFLGCVDMMETI